MAHIKLYLLSGFLGSGKTTLLKRITDEVVSHKIGIVMNEFGKISIDGPIVDDGQIEMIELTRGSIFCSCLKFSFAEALIDLSKKDIDYVIVESSGLADPSNIGEILEAVEPMAQKKYMYAGSINVIDGLNFLEQYQEIETITRQIECADLTIINKTDLIDPKQCEAIESIINAINPETEVIHSSFFSIPVDFIGKNLTNGYIKHVKDSLNTPENKPKTISLTFSGDISKAKFDEFLRDVWPSTYRIKGFVSLDGSEYQVDVVGKKTDYLEKANKLESSTLVFISKIGPQIIRVVDQAWKKQMDHPMKLGN